MRSSELQGLPQTTGVAAIWRCFCKGYARAGNAYPFIKNYNMQSIIQSIAPRLSISNAMRCFHYGLKGRQNDNKLSKTTIASKVDDLCAAGMRVPESACQKHYQQYTVNRNAAAI
jgi:hypothetical protein